MKRLSGHKATMEARTVTIAFYYHVGRATTPIFDSLACRDYCRELLSGGPFRVDRGRPYKYGFITRYSSGQSS